MVHANTCHNYKQTRVGLHCASEPGGPCFVASHEGGLCSPFCDQRELDCPHKNGCMIILFRLLVVFFLHLGRLPIAGNCGPGT